MEDMYLWPNTPIGKSDQNIIARRVGASDNEHLKKESRPFKIIRELKKLINCGKIKETASILDITCADAIVISKIKLWHSNMNIYGIDCAKNEFSYSDEVLKSGVKLYRVFIQHLFKSKPPKKIDVAIMLNTYRGWHSAQLKPKDSNLPELADDYFEAYCHFIFITATKEQIDRLHHRFNIKLCGTGESDSYLVLLSKEKISNPFAKKLFNYFKYKIFL